MTLCDASALIALINANDRNHDRCVNALSQLNAPLITTWACYAETMHLLGHYGGWPAQEKLWGYLNDEILHLHVHSQAEEVRMEALMAQYRDIPMDLGDASLVVAAETLQQTVIFTLDRDFYIYRLPHNQSFQVVPGRD
ncbi:MAG: hypothetical protein RLZZ511_2446 [Cyanobacteriota bacterium]|jgi:predicted nucleic acid-binding protein